jgi:hypothetical protein
MTAAFWGPMTGADFCCTNAPQDRNQQRMDVGMGGCLSRAVIGSHDKRGPA